MRQSKTEVTFREGGFEFAHQGKEPKGAQPLTAGITEPFAEAPGALPAYLRSANTRIHKS